jgi:hypothetical protein
MSKTKQPKLFQFADGPGEIREGQQVIVTNGQGGRHYRADETKVEKIGRELVHMGYHGSWYFDGKKKTEYAGGRVYSSMSAYERCMREQIVISTVERKIHDYHTNLTYEQALKIAEILGLDTSEQEGT